MFGWFRRRTKEKAVATVTVSVNSDSAALFRAGLLVREKDGDSLAEALDRLLKVHPKVGTQVVQVGSLGRLSYGNAVGALREYAHTKVAVMPERL